MLRALLGAVLLWAPVALAQTIEPPRLLEEPALVYPAGAEGSAEVRLLLVIDERGLVAEVRQVPGSAAPIFVQAAEAFVRDLRFAPATTAGTPIAVEVEYVVRFAPPAKGPVATFEVDVVGSAPEAPAAGEFVVEAQRYAAVPRRSAEELLTLAPGVILRNHAGEGHASAIFLRGFDAGEGQDLEFRLDGVPLNEVSNPHGHGYADTHFILPELVEEVRVIEGPFDPAQGDFAVAGSAHYRLGLREEGLRLQVGAGSYDAQELLLLWGRGEEAPGTFVGLRLRKGDGFGVNRAYQGATAMAGWEHELGERTRLRLVGYGHSMRFDSAGIVRADQVAAGALPCGASADEQFFCTPNPDQGGASSRHGAHAVLERRTSRMDLQQVAFFSSRRLRLREDFTGFLLDEQGRGDGTEQLYDAVSFGLRGSLSLHRDGLGHRQTLTVGYDVRHDDGTAIMRRLARSGGHAFARMLDEELRITGIGAFAGGTLRPIERLELRGGVRVDAHTFDVTDRNRPTSTRAGEREPSESMDAGGLAVQPRVAARLTLVEGLDWLSAFGVGARSSDAAALSAGEFAPFARVRAAETGLAFREGPYGLRLVGFLTHVDRDLVFDPERARNVFAGASSRHGALLVASGSRWGVDAQGSVTWAEAHLVPEGAGFFDLGQGQRLPFVPRLSARLDVVSRGTLPDFAGALPVRGGLGLTFVGKRQLPHERVGEGYTTVDAGGAVRWGTVELGLSVHNLLDTRYHLAEFSHASNFSGVDATPSRMSALHFAAGPPRLLLATVALILDGQEDER